MSDTITTLSYQATQSNPQLWMNQGTPVSISTSENQLNFQLRYGRPILVTLIATVAFTWGTATGVDNNSQPANTPINVLVSPIYNAVTTLFVTGSGSGTLTITPIDDPNAP